MQYSSIICKTIKINAVYYQIIHEAEGRCQTFTALQEYYPILDAVHTFKLTLDMLSNL